MAGRFAAFGGLLKNIFAPAFCAVEFVQHGVLAAQLN
jgi:hypothetical protein